MPHQRSSTLSSDRHTARLNSDPSVCDMDSDLQCPVCLELFRLPVILPCSHVICRKPCAENLTSSGALRCPVCRETAFLSSGLDSLPRVLPLQNIVEKFKADRRSRSADSEDDSPFPDARTDNVRGKQAVTSALDLDDVRESRGQRADDFTTAKWSSQEVTGAWAKCPLAACEEHGGEVSFFCTQCSRPFCLVCEEPDAHGGHQFLSLEEAFLQQREALSRGCENLVSHQCSLLSHIRLLKDNFLSVQRLLSRRREEVHAQCDALVAEVESKRTHFLCDLQQEERSQRVEVEDAVASLERHLTDCESVTALVRDYLGGNPMELLRECNTLNNRLVETGSQSSLLPQAACWESDANFRFKIVDFREELSVLRQMSYLSVPRTPVLEVSRCCRGDSMVALAVSAPKPGLDLVDHFLLRYCSQEQRDLGLEEMLTVRACVDTSPVTWGGSADSECHMLLLEDLGHETTYYFRLGAGNAAGLSAASPIVHCTTLASGDAILPVPMILESLCRTSSHAVVVHCSLPPGDDTEVLHHCLLFRPRSQNRMWRAFPLTSRQEQRVSGLASDTEYEFTVLASNSRGECQLSNKVCLHTDLECPMP